MNKKQFTTFTYLASASIVATLLLFIAPAVPARAATINVDCSVSALILAINNANLNPGADTLELSPACTFTLTYSNNDNGLGPNGLPIITSDITVNGNNAIIARSTTDGTPGFRFFQIQPNGTLTLNQLTLTNGRTPDGTGPGINAPHGGAIYNNGQLHLSKVTFTDNAAGGGGGTFYGFFNSGGDGGNGGAIYNLKTLTMTQAVFVGNTAGGAGRGGCFDEVCADAGVAGAGGAIYSNGPTTITQTSFANNAAGAGGFTNFGGAGGYGGALWNANQLSIESSTFVGNLAGNSGMGEAVPAVKAGYGGAIYNTGSATLANLTLSSNRAGNGAMGPGGNGGGIANQGGTILAYNLTLSENAAGTGYEGNGIGGNISNSGTFTLTNSLVANSTLGGNCAGTLVNGGNNLSSDNTCKIGSIVNPRLDPAGLQDNGGPTQTIALESNSPALDAGSDAVCGAAPVNGQDQRGVARPQGTHCDIGAFEFVPVRTIQEYDTTIQYNGWRGEPNPEAIGGTYRASNLKNDTLTFRFNGNQVTWITRRGPELGKARVSIDGVDKGIVDLYNPTAQWQYAKTFRKLPAGKHKLELTVLGSKNNASGDTTVIADAFRVNGVTIDETANAIKYYNWAGKANANASDGKYRSGNNAHAVARFTFTGTSVEWLTAMGPNYGQAQVWLDGTDMGVYDFYATIPEWQVVRSFTDLSFGVHTLEIHVLGTHHPNSTGKSVIVDAFRGPFQ